MAAMTPVTASYLPDQNTRTHLGWSSAGVISSATVGGALNLSAHNTMARIIHRTPCISPSVGSGMRWQAARWMCRHSGWQAIWAPSMRLPAHPLSYGQSKDTGRRHCRLAGHIFPSLWGQRASEMKRTPQETLDWLLKHQPNNWEAIEAVRRTLGIHGTRRREFTDSMAEPEKAQRSWEQRQLTPAPNKCAPQSNWAAMAHNNPTVDSDFYNRLKALYARSNTTVYQCCKKLGLETGPNSRMDEAERMVCQLTNQGFISWHGSEPIFQ